MTPRSGDIKFYLLAIVGVCAVGVAGIVALEVLRPDVDRGLILQIFGFLAPTVAALLALARGIANGQAIEQTRQETKEVARRVESTESKLEGTAEAVEKLRKDH